MTKRKSMTRNQNHNDASSRKRIKTCNNGGVTHWSDLHHDLLFLVMMQLRIFDFVAFSGVCKSWRSLALPNKNMFMASKPPMLMSISTCANKVDCYLEDFEGRKIKTILPHCGGGDTFVGLTCGYLIIFRKKTRDFWLVNPITKHGIHFPPLTGVYISGRTTTAILVFSPSISRWVFVILNNYSFRIWYFIAGKGAWNHVSSALPIHDLHAFKGKIYTVDRYFHVYELKLNPKPKLTLLKTKQFWKKGFGFLEYVSSDENLYVMEILSIGPYMVCELDIGEKKWVSFEETKDEYVFFHDTYKHAVVVKPNSWAKADTWSQYRIFDNYGNRGNWRFFNAKLWYFPHECLKVNILNEW